MSKTLNVESLTNSVLMAVAKELAKNDISIYETDPNQMWRNAIRTMVASSVADKHFELAEAATARAEDFAKKAADETKAARKHLAAAAALKKAA